ncbi:MAG: sugar ABC transporter substrate-binding protein [bacterium]|nr:sugar ABC transporter substrate-binding protein [bacterium]
MTANTLRRRLAASTALLALSAGSAFAEVELDFWDQVWGGPEYIATAGALVEAFNAAHPDIHVTYRSVPWASWYETYVTAIASGSAPDISTGAGFQAVQFYDFGEILPVGDVASAIGAETFAAGTLEAVTYDEQIVALPWTLDTRAIFYRTDLLEAAGITPPTTWEEFRAATKALTGNGVYGLVSSGDTTGSHWVSSITINNGGGLFDAERKAALASDASTEALHFLADLVADGSVNPASAGYSNDDAIGSFVRGEAAFILNSPNLADLAGEAGPNIAVLPPLTSPHGTKGTVYWVNNIMVYRQTEHPEETMTFLKWWSDNQLPLWTEGNGAGLPARMAYQQDAYFTEREQVSDVIAEYLPVAKPMSAVAGGTFPAMNVVDGDGFLRTLIQTIWQGGDVDAAIADAQAHLEDVLAD